jgi:serine phosphatase RsbU (regulator of sigma subunit)
MSQPRRVQSAFSQQVPDHPIHILYMEDDPGLARLVQKRLGRAGYMVHIAADGREGLSQCNSGDYELLLVDQNMPVYDGLDVIRSLADRNALPPTIMITGAGSEMIAVEALKLGASDYLVKDVEGGYLDLLPSLIGHVLAQEHLQQEKLASLEREMELAHRIQVSLLPQQAPQVPGLAIAARSVPARQVGGDFYRYLSLPDGSFGLIIGDVSGKGTPAALLMAMTLTSIDSQLHGDFRPADLLAHLNRMLYPRLQPSRTIIGLLVALFDPKRRYLQISSAGMIDPLLVDKTNIYWLEVSGLPIGALPALAYVDQEVSLDSPATLILASDGIVEAMNADGELFGFERLEQVVAARKEEEDPHRLLDCIWEAVSHHVGSAEAHDDMSLMVVCVRPQGNFSAYPSDERRGND